MKSKLLLIALLFLKSSLAQNEDSLNIAIENKPMREKVMAPFKSTRVIMSHSIQMLKPGVLDFLILHRFGNVNRGLYEFFGLDQATFRLAFDYGLTKDLTLGIGRSSHKKELDGFIKYRIIHQATGPNATPFSLVVVGGTTLNTLKFADPTRKNLFSSRLGYYAQVLAGRKFSEAFSLQLMPTVVHQNLVTTSKDPNDLYAAGIGGRIKLSKRISLNADYYYVINKNETLENFHNPLSIGFDIETGGHIFQLHFTNAVGMNERVFLTETINNWGDGDIQFGFNISRAFQIKKKRSPNNEEN
ncbi:MAG TPA: DUF5777 family beta-barrel protein [Chitinophagaceae bacterium]|nr:DUF5777 family beta-barrel protein [Chitinophagaceae bacterium]